MNNIVHIRDVEFTKQFLQDWEQVPKRVQNAFSTKIDRIAMTGKMLPSVSAHKDRLSGSDYWIGYVNLGSGGYRFLFWLADDVMICDRLLDHEQMERLLLKS